MEWNMQIHYKIFYTFSGEGEGVTIVLSSLKRYAHVEYSPVLQLLDFSVAPMEL